MKKIIGLMFACFLFSVSINAQKACSKTCKKTCTEAEMKACAEKMGISLAECKKMCSEKGLAEVTKEANTRVASATVELPTCCYSALMADGKVCCKGYEASIADADMLIDAEGTEIKKYVCPMSAAKASTDDKDETRVASVIMVKEATMAPKKATGKKSCSKSCSKSCASKKKGA